MNLNAYSPQIIIGACAVVLVVMLLIIWGVARQRAHRRTAELRSRFGPEYDYAVQEYGSRRKAEAALEARLRRMENVTLRTLTDQERRRFMAEWDGVQARFVDHPRGAVTEADEMISGLLQARGYPGARFDQRAWDLSVHHPKLVDPYRRANAIVAKAGKNEATTEELRTALILYRALFEEILQPKMVTMPKSQAA